MAIDVNNAIDGNSDFSPTVPVAGALSRLNYFFGQLLTQRDLEAEQSFHLRLQRLIQRESFGTGTVAGLALQSTAASRPRGVMLRAGMAMDPDGRELLVERDACIIVAEEAQPAAAAGLRGDDPSTLAEELSALWNAAIDKEETAALAKRLAEAGAIESDDAAALRDALNAVAPDDGSTLPAGTNLADYLFDRLVATTYVGLRYHERGAEPSPTTLSGGCCGDERCFPARIQEGVSVVLQAEPFADIADPYADARAAMEACESPEAVQQCLCDYLLGAWRGVPATKTCQTDALAVVPLATVQWLRFGAADRILTIDNCSSRPLAPGSPVLRAMRDVLGA